VENDSGRRRVNIVDLLGVSARDRLDLSVHDQLCADEMVPVVVDGEGEHVRSGRRHVEDSVMYVVAASDVCNLCKHATLKPKNKYFLFDILFLL